MLEYVWEPNPADYERQDDEALNSKQTVAYTSVRPRRRAIGSYRLAICIAVDGRQQLLRVFILREHPDHVWGVGNAAVETKAPMFTDPQQPSSRRLEHMSRVWKTKFPNKAPNDRRASSDIRRTYGMNVRESIDFKLSILHAFYS